MKKKVMIPFLAVFSAVIAVISFLPIRTAGLEITLSMVPVAVGAICFGPAAGAFLGGVFGVVSFLQCLGWSPFGAALLAINPWFALLVCLPTRILAGWLTGWIFRAMSRHSKRGELLAYPVASLSAAVLNTTFFMSALVLLFYRTELIQGFVTVLGAANPFLFVLAFVGINGLVEIGAGFVLATPCAMAVTRVLRRRS